MRTTPLLALALGLSLASCADPRLQDASGDLVFSTSRLELGEAFLGETAVGGDELEATVVLLNRGRSALDVDWEVPGPPWSFEPLPDVVPSGSTSIRIRFSPESPGRSEAALRAVSRGRRISLLVAATASVAPTCPTAGACQSFRYDPALGRCVEESVVDGTACDPGTVCVTAATCQAGRCVGTPIVCDDGNACTADTCNALTGCEFPPMPPCPGDGECRVGVCDPAVGCGLELAPDGFSCGDATCDVAQVCIGGACVARDPPDGFICQEASPCQQRGVCVGSTCTAPPKTALPLEWSSHGLLDTSSLHDFVMEPSGEMTLLGFYGEPAVRANSPLAIPLAPASARRCILWNAHLACADFREKPTSPDGAVALIDLSTGAPLWTFELRNARPDWAAEAQPLFMARLAGVGTDRLIALYEAYPKSQSASTQLRMYFLVLLDAKGKLVLARKFDHAFLKAPNHPHPYGLAADRAGNVYISFAPSPATGTPLQPLTPTFLVSFTRDGVERWSRTEMYAGGELAVSGGLLFPENAPSPHDAASGAPMPSTSSPLPQVGRVVSDGARWIAGPVPGDRALFAADMNGQAKWTHWLGGSSPLQGTAFASWEVRYAEWSARPGHGEPVVLAMITRPPQPMAPEVSEIAAFRPSDGKERWSCELASTPLDPVNLFELGRESLGVMTNAETCGRCDPPHAQSQQAIFWQYALPGVFPARVPWPGTFGGAGHDHVEDPMLAPPVSSR